MVCPIISVIFNNFFFQALQHLNERLIDTRRPEEIRGGGLLKYCHLLIRGYKAARPNKCRQLERYMCSRFFIDFPEVNRQEVKLRAYLDNHFGTEDQVTISSITLSILKISKIKTTNYKSVPFIFYMKI